MGTGGPVGRGAHVSFPRFWRGMEGILQDCAVFQDGGLDAAVRQKVGTLREFRNLVLDQLERSQPNERGLACMRISDLDRLYARLQSRGDPVVAAYWGERLNLLRRLSPPSELVLEDEVAAALLQWLEDAIASTVAVAGLAWGTWLRFRASLPSVLR